MAGTESRLFDITFLDMLACRKSRIHRLDARAKVLTTFIFVVVVASFDKYAVVSLLPLFLFPLALLVVARLPLAFLLKRLLLVAPFAVLVGVFNPFLDHQAQLLLGTFEVTGGWLSFMSILLRFTLTVGMALVLIAVTSFPGICNAIDKLGAPRIFALQLLFLYRYIFVLGEEAHRMVRARSLRSFHGRGNGLKVYGALLTQLLWRTMDRAQRVHKAMLSRGFVGRVPLLQMSRFRWQDGAFIGLWCSFFVMVRVLSESVELQAWVAELLK